MGGLTAYIANVAMMNSTSRLQTDVSLSMLKKAMNTEEAQGATLIQSLSEMAPPADGRGALLDVRA